MLKIVFHGSGQLGNQLIFAANVIASAYEYEFKVKYYNFPKFEGIKFSNSQLDEMIIKKNLPLVIIWKLITWCMMTLKITKIMNVVFVSQGGLKTEDFFCFNELKKHNVYWFGWPYIDWFSLRKNADLLRDYFKFTNVENAKKSSQSYLVAIHIRRGDYKIWRQGLFYFEDDVYIKVAQKVKIALNAEVNEIDRIVSFVVFSNEPIDILKWKNSGLDISFSQNDPITDLSVMSKCQLIVAPPSTFSAWASFIGRVKRFVIDSNQKNFDLGNCFVAYEETDSFGNVI